MKQRCVIFLFIFSTQLWAQDNRSTIAGQVTIDSLAIENVHIVNLNSNVGTLSDRFGLFRLPIILHDTILFSSMQLQSKKMIIQPEHLNQKILKIELSIKVNKLPEVIVDRQENTKGVNAVTLRLPNSDKEPLNQLERKLNYYSQAPVAIVILATLLGQSGGIDDIYNIVSGNRRKDRKLKNLLDGDMQNKINQEYIQIIRNHFQDDFFIKTNHITKEKINSFIEHCLPKNIIYLFDKERHLEIMDIFISESNNFNRILHLTKH